MCYSLLLVPKDKIEGKGTNKRAKYQVSTSEYDGTACFPIIERGRNSIRLSSLEYFSASVSTFCLPLQVKGTNKPGGEQNKLACFLSRCCLISVSARQASESTAVLTFSPHILHPPSRRNFCYVATQQNLRRDAARFSSGRSKISYTGV